MGWTLFLVKSTLAWRNIAPFSSRLALGPEWGLPQNAIPWVFGTNGLKKMGNFETQRWAVAVPCGEDTDATAEGTTSGHRESNVASIRLELQ